MSTITTRAGKGSPLTNNEVDANFTNLNTDKAELSGAAFTGAITTTSTVDGRDVATDGTKLDGIEAGADVTDTAAVTAAGALMDSELTSEASVKALNQGVATTDSPTFAGLTTSADINFGDSDKAIFGAGSDLQIYHNANNSFIQDAGTGSLYIDGSASVNIRETSTNAPMAVFTGSGSVDLYHNGIKKLATTSTGIDVTGNMIADGVGIGTSSPNRDLSVAGVISAQTTANDASILLLPIASENRIYSRAGDASTTALPLTFRMGDTERMRIDASGNLLLGVTTAYSGGKLSVNGGIVQPSGVQNVMGVFGTSGLQMIGVTGGDNVIGTMGANEPLVLRTGSAERLRINSSGNVGINQSNPTQKLHVSGNAIITGLTRIGDGTASSPSYQFVSDTDTGMYRASSNILGFSTGGTERMRIDSSGRVGIGTSSPASRLTLKAGDNSYAGGFRIEGTDETTALAITHVNGDNFFSGNGTDDHLVLTGTGNVGIGTSSPLNQLVISEGTGQHGIEFAAGTTSYIQAYDRATSDYGDLKIDAQTIAFGTDNGAERLRIDSSGNVGIGTSSPAIGGGRTYDVALTIDGGVSGGVEDTGALEVGGSTSVNDRLVGSISYFNRDNSGAGATTRRQVAIIEARSVTSDSNAGDDSGANLTFSTKSEGGSVAERMRIDSSGRLLVGQTGNYPATGGGTTKGVFAANADSRTDLIVSNQTNGSNAGAALVLGAHGQDHIIESQSLAQGGGLTFTRSATEHMRIDSSGNLLVGTTTAGDGISYGTYGVTTIKGEYGAMVKSTGGAGYEVLSLWNTTASGTIYQVIFRDGASGAARGTITTNGSVTAYNTSSDYRLKENVVAMSGATERLKQLNPSRFNFIADADTTVDGFLAHEVQAVVPEAITGTKDAMMDEEYEVTPAVLDDDGNVTTEAVMGTRSVPDYQGIDQSKLVPLLVATIQELEARITQLENN